MKNREYQQIAEAINYLSEQADDQPSLDKAAKRAGLSNVELQRLFRSCLGTTPKQFLEQLTIRNAKARLNVSASNTPHVHDLLIEIDAVTSKEYKARSTVLTLRYGCAPSPFGMAFAAMAPRGLCALAFVDDGGDKALAQLIRDWPGATLVHDDSAASGIVERAFGKHDNKPIRLFVKGTDYQVRIWRALLDIPEGTITNYGAIALALGEPRSARAVGTAIGANRVGLLIPCHRVIPSTGAYGTYRWGSWRKRALIAWEAARRGTATP